jgi:hypothetical protein
MSKPKRQPSHHCPACHKYSLCAREVGMADCPVPRDIMCGSCVVVAQRLIAQWKKPCRSKPRDKRRLNKKARQAR